MAFALGAVVAGALTGLVALRWGGRDGHGGAEARRGPTTASMPSSASAVDHLLRDFGAAHQKAGQAIDEVQRCQGTATGAAATLQEALAARRENLAKIPGLDFHGLPDGSAMQTTLTQLGRDLIELDDSWLTWLRASHSSCGPADGPELQRAQADQQRVEAEETGFLALWAPIADRYDLKRWSPGDL